MVRTGKGYGPAACALAVATIGAAPAAAQVTNGSFETGAFAPWAIDEPQTAVGPSSVQPVGPDPQGMGLIDITASDGGYAGVHYWLPSTGGTGNIVWSQDMGIAANQKLCFDYRTAWDYATSSVDHTLKVLVYPAGGGGFSWQTTTVLTAHAGTVQPDTGWQSAEVSMANFGGQTRQIRFAWFVHFGTEGPSIFLLDHVRLVGAGESCAIAPPGCTGAADCDDGVACTVDTCDAGSGACQHAASAALCDDGLGCTSDTCNTASGCVHTALEGCCLSSGECDDGIACTVDTCNLTTGACAHDGVGCLSCTGVSPSAVEPGVQRTFTLAGAGFSEGAAVAFFGPAGFGLLGTTWLGPTALEVEALTAAEEGTYTAVVDAAGTPLPCPGGVEVSTAFCAGLFCEGACSTDHDCLDGDACTQDVCAGGECAHAVDPLCCAPFACEPCALRGLLTGDDTVDIVDTQCTILSLLWAGNGKPWPAPACLERSFLGLDLDCNGQLDIADVLLEIQTALGLPVSALLDTDGDGCPDLCAP